MRRSLIIDGQVFQTPAWHRGMGKYSLELVNALNELNTRTQYWHEIEVILSHKLPTEPSVRAAFKQRMPGVKITVLQLAPNEYDNRSVATRNRKVVDKFVAGRIQENSLQTIDFLILSLMQSEIAPTFPSLTTVHNFLLFYDLIPLMFHKTYLTDAINQKSYLSKLAELLRADSYFAISKTVANDLSLMLGIDKKRIISIDGAPIEHGHKVEKFDVPKPFILMPTGNDLRKNNRRGIEGFSIFNQKHNNKYSLVITSSFQDYEIREFKKLCPQVVFTGNIKGEELAYLYQETEGLLFPTEYEGLGLPILEALEKNKPVACSDISVFREISDKAFFYFDPKEPAAIAQALNTAIKSKKLPLKEYARVLDTFTWKRTANLFMEHSRNLKLNKNTTSNKQKLAIFCPPPDETWAGTEAQRLYSELQRLAAVSYYMDPMLARDKKNINYLIHITETAHVAQLTHTETVSMSPVYFLRNTAYCATTLLVALAKPGVIVLQEMTLENVWQEALKKKLIHSTRLLLEKQLSSQFNDRGWLVSLLAGQRCVIVQKKESKKLLENLISEFPENLRPKVIYAAQPQVELVYNELIPDLSLVDYPVMLNPGKPHQTFHEFAKILYTESMKAQNQNE
jgi:glycosyltransferase involved in cell wall biosynthesis